MKLLNNLERRLYRLPLKPFYRYVVFAMAGVFVLDLFFRLSFNLSGLLQLSWPLVMRGQVWRLVTFLVVPPPFASPLTLLLTLYFYYFIGTSLENRWGVRRFFIYYVIGAVGTIVGAAITGYATNMYLNMSLFFAFALLYPDFQLLLFFAVPVKLKWLALLNAVFYLWSLLYVSWPERISLVVSLLNLVLFFGGDMITQGRNMIFQWRRRQAFKNSWKK